MWRRDGGVLGAVAACRGGAILSFVMVRLAALGLPARVLAMGLATALAMGCSATPPPNWAQGGAAVEIPRARWARGDLTVDVMSDGRVLLNGEHELTIDRAGRVFDPEAEPIALLEPDGRVIGADEMHLGVVGSDHASLPGHATAWLSVLPTGEVVRYDEDGERYGFGVWTGCTEAPRARQVCTLISHLLGMRTRAAERPSGVTIGVGVGVGVPLR